MHCTHPFRNIIIIIVWFIFFPGRKKKINVYPCTLTHTHSYIDAYYIQIYPNTMRAQPELLLRAFIPSRKTGCAKILSPIVRRRRPDTGCFRFSPPRVPDEIKYADVHTGKNNNKNRGRGSRRYIYIYIKSVYYNVLCIAMVQELYTGR